MKAVLMSIQPKWCELIASGKKKIEVRKSKPTLKTPFKCYIYETRSGGHSCKSCNQKDDCYFYAPHGVGCYKGSGKIIGEFVCDKIEEIEPDYADWLPKHRYDVAPKTFNGMCLTENELWDYGNGKILYAWHISDLKIYDEPKKLSEFRKPCDRFLDCFLCRRYKRDEFGGCDSKIRRPPQSWCYVEEIRQ